jgi:tRNA modification GTPase
MDTPTIAAIASPPGSGGIGIIRISGPDAVGIALRIFRHRNNANGGDSGREQRHLKIFRSHRLYYGHIFDPKNCNVLDEVLLFTMRAPRSYTREDVVEIQAHAGPAVMRNILALILRQGARMAEPGEFTRRAFLNGRIDLTQAEAVIDLISAQTDAAFKAAANQVSGRLKKVVENVRTHLSDLLVQIEAGIDFPEDLAVIRTGRSTEKILQTEVAEPIQNLIMSYREAHIYRDGIAVAIVGRPNAGKSSLLNCLVDNDRAIVNPVPGTTRDLIDCTFQLQGIPVNVTDTAGIHATLDPVELIGISKSRACIHEAQLVLLVLDASDPIKESDHRVYEYCRNKPIIYVINKTDLTPNVKSASNLPPTSWKPGTRVPISALYGTGIDQLKAHIFSAVVDNPESIASHALIPNLRHYGALEKCHQNLKSVGKGLQEKRPMELVAIDIYAALGSLDDILGNRAEDDLLDQIFSRFCIGK